MLSQDPVRGSSASFHAEIYQETRWAVMAASQNWESFFCNWPAALPRKGVVTTSLNETIPFRSFWLKDGMVLIERVTPDALGARFVLLSFEAINVVKFTDPLTTAIIADAGFGEPAAKRQPQLA